MTAATFLRFAPLALFATTYFHLRGVIFAHYAVMYFLYNRQRPRAAVPRDGNGKTY